MDITENQGTSRTGRLDIVKCRNLIYESLIRTGRINVIKSHLSDLLRFSGWTNMMRSKCTEYIENEGIENVNFSHMLCDVIPYGREQVPSEIRESMRDILRSIALAQFTPEEINQLEEDEQVSSSDTYLPYEYQPRDKVPDYGDLSVFNQHPDIRSPSPSEMLSPSISVDPTPTTSAPNLSREMGGIILLDRIDLDKENEKLGRENAEQKEKELKEREKQERERIRQELEKERHERVERERQEQKERDRQERKEREAQELERSELKERDRPEPSSRERRERQGYTQSSSVPSSPSNPRPEKKRALTEALSMMKLGQGKGQALPPSQNANVLTPPPPIDSKKSKHITLNTSDNEDDDDDEELMDI